MMMTLSMPLERAERTWRRLANRRSILLVAALALSGIMLAASPFFIMVLREMIFLEGDPHPLVLLALIGPLAIIGGSFLLIRRTSRMMTVIESSIVARGGVSTPPAPLLARLLRDLKFGFVLVNGGIIAVLAGMVILSTMGFDGARNQIELFLILYFGGMSATVLGVYVLVTRNKKK